MSDVQLTPVRDAHKFDEAALATFLDDNIEGYRGPATIRQFEGGQSNPTFLLEAASGRYVVRKQPPGELLPSAHQVDREYRVMKGLDGTEVPVPKMYCLCEDPAVIGTKFYVMEMVEGRLFTETLLPSLTPVERGAIYSELAHVLATLHNVDPEAVGLEEFGRPGNYYERQINRWTKQYLASQTENIEAMTKLMEWLPRNIPEPGKTVIVHGDYRLGNTLIHPTEPKLVALLDWELSTLGDGLADLQLGFELDQDCCGNLVLDGEHVGELAVVGFRPHVITVLYFDQLGSNSQLIARFAHRSFQDVRHAQCFTDDFEILVLAFECE